MEHVRMVLTGRYGLPASITVTENRKCLSQRVLIRKLVRAFALIAPSLAKMPRGFCAKRREALAEFSCGSCID